MFIITTAGIGARGEIAASLSGWADQVKNLAAGKGTRMRLIAEEPALVTREHVAALEVVGFSVEHDRTAFGYAGAETTALMRWHQERSITVLVMRPRQFLLALARLLVAELERADWLTSAKLAHLSSDDAEQDGAWLSLARMGIAIAAAW